MPCNGPLKAYYSKEFGPNGKRRITFDRNSAFSGVPLWLPCGQCTGCRLDHSLSWGIRCMHEKMLHSESSFATLTFDDEHLPKDMSLCVDTHQRFMKRMRKKMGKNIRFYMCGEYGSLYKRPHYHYLFFNKDFSDKKFYKMTDRGEKLYTSELLYQLWPFGMNTIGEVTLESCCYVSRYICDKITGDAAEAHYAGRLPEFTCMSRKPGIAAEWYEKYGQFSHKSGDFAVLDGKRVKMPRYYDNKYEIVDSNALSVLKKRRRRKAIRHRADSTPDRRRVREIVLRERLKANRREM